MSERSRHARALFAPLGPTYDRVGAALSFGQDPRWRRFLVSRLPADGGHVLDVATGTGLVASALLERGYRVTGLDQSPGMLARARERFDGRVELVEASAEELPFPDGSFDHLTFTYLLRYVDDPGATLRELARVVRPGGTVAMLEFGLPARDLATAVGPLGRRRAAAGGPRCSHPAGTRSAVSSGRSIRDFHARYPEPASSGSGEDAGLADVRSRTDEPRRRARRCGRGAGDAAHHRVARQLRPSFYALRPGGWRDYVTLLHLPYTAWHLSYVVVGGCLAATVDWSTLWLTVLAFALAMGIGAHALDELHGRPLGTTIPSPVLVGLAVASVAAAAAIGVGVALERTLWILPLVAVGVALVPVYNLELLGGRAHTDLGFALSWGAFPALTAFVAQTGSVRIEAVLAAAWATLLSLAQRRLSHTTRRLRRETATVEGAARPRRRGARAAHARGARGAVRDRAPPARGRDRRPRGDPRRAAHRVASLYPARVAVWILAASLAAALAVAALLVARPPEGARRRRGHLPPRRRRARRRGRGGRRGDRVARRGDPPRARAGAGGDRLAAGRRGTPPPGGAAGRVRRAGAANGRGARRRARAHGAARRGAPPGVRRGPRPRAAPSRGAAEQPRAALPPVDRARSSRGSRPRPPSSDRPRTSSARRSSASERSWSVPPDRR